MEGELQKIRDGVFALMDKKLIPSPSTDESKTFYYMKGDYYRYLVEFATGDAKSKAWEHACFAYAEDTKIAEKDLVVTHHIQAFYYKMRSDCYRHLAEVATGKTRSKAGEDCLCRLCGSHQDRRERPGRVQSCFLAIAMSSVVAQRQIPIDQTVQKTVEIPQLGVIEKIVDTLIPQIVQELAEISKVFPQDRVQQCSTDQTIEIPDVSLVEKIV